MQLQIIVASVNIRDAQYWIYTDIKYAGISALLKYVIFLCYMLCNINIFFREEHQVSGPLKSW